MVDITPDVDAALPMSGYSGRTEGFKSIHDPLHVRTIVVDDGGAQAAIVSCEVLYFTPPLWERITQRITEQTRIRRENILLSSVHTHAAPTLAAPAGRPARAETGRVRRHAGETDRRIRPQAQTRCSRPGPASAPGRRWST